MPRLSVIDQLRDDHRIILRFLSLLELYADRLGTGQVQGRHAALVLSFVDEFIERYHHVREEHVLFRFLAEKGRAMDRQGTHLVHCHDEARDQLEGMRLATPPHDGERRTAFAWNAMAFANLIREHVVMEESWLYPRIEEILDPQDLAELSLRMQHEGAEDLRCRGRALDTLTHLEEACRLGAATETGGTVC